MTHFYYRLNQKVVCLTSPVLLRQFLTSIFINVDISVREGQLFCDVICDKGPLLKGQVRLFYMIWSISNVPLILSLLMIWFISL